MITIKLIRESYNQNGVFGTMRIKDTDLQKDMVIRTVERIQVPEDWKKLSPTQRMKYCIPTGQYPMKWVFDVDLDLRFVIKGVSTWQTMHFTGSNLNVANVIKVGTEATTDGYVKEGTRVMEELSEYLQALMNFGFIPMTPKYGFFTLEIENSPTYHEESVIEDAVVGADSPQA
ncbi:MAG: hypothetical protein Q4D25_10625 [Bacteroidales bacterium]|jgi:hypothetical protein|nr:hypothetical protein [Bacteroidaceae bacterium]MDO4202550.1 hypothetical protein [Bacteroidales bacterium]